MIFNLILNPLPPNHNTRRLAFLRRRSPPISSAFTPTEMMLPDSLSTSLLLRRVLVAAVFLFGVSLSGYVLFRAADSVGFRLPDSLDPSSSGLFYVFPSTSTTDIVTPPPDSDESRLARVLKAAAMPDRTVILTTLNEAWAARNSVIDLFLQSFRIGDGTRKLLDHLVIVALDQKAYSRCKVLHSHCFALSTEGVDFSQEAYFMTPDYLNMMWRRIDFLRYVLEMGYNFVFTDADIMWFRNPFQHFHLDADFQIACDHFSGNSSDVETNRPNGGFTFVRSNNRSIDFYKFWYASRETYPGLHDQDVLNRIKYDSFITDIELKIRFLNTAYFGGFCEPSKDLNKVCTMHANCCFGLESKVHDLRILLRDWRKYMSLPPNLKRSSILHWRAPQNCSLSNFRRFDPPHEEDATDEG